MSGNPEVTVIMPVYNGGKYLRLSIDSILAQTHGDFEFLIVNDCSTDDSMETIRSYKDPRIVVHCNAANMGQTKSLNVGLKLAKGKYVVINDADDLSLPHRIEKQLDHIKKNPGNVVVGGSAFIMDGGGKIYRTFRKPTDFKEILIWILSDTPLIHGSVIMDRAAILANGGYDESFRICQDYELWSRLLRKGYRLANIPDIIVSIRQYVDSISFTEKGAQTEENGRIIYENIKALTGTQATVEDAVRQRLFIAVPHQLDPEDFKRAAVMFEMEYENLKESAGVSRAIARRDLKSKIMKPYCKMAVHHIRNGRMDPARNIAHDFLGNYGFSPMPFLLWSFASCGGKTARGMLSCYEKWRGVAARINSGECK